jgi:hypothetical protein
MAPSFLRTLFGQKKSASDAEWLSILEAVKSVLKPEMPASEIADQEHRKALESGPTAENATTNVNSLFAFVDPKDPFTTGEIAGSKLQRPCVVTDRN